MLQKRAFVTAAILLSITVLAACGHLAEREKLQLFAQGQLHYQQACQNCHGKDGKGLQNLYPPLAKADYLMAEGNTTAILCMMRHGYEGALVVNGITYRRPMPGVQELTAHEAAAILTYIRNAWGNQAPHTTEAEVNEAWASCATALPPPADSAAVEPVAPF